MRGDWIVVVGALCACSSADQDDLGTTSLGTGGLSATTAEPSGTSTGGVSMTSMDPPPGTTSATSASSGETGPSVIFDVATDLGAGETGAQRGCQKIDFLFAIDNSGSMYDKQQRLLEAFPAFIGAIQEEVQGQDHHIMVVDSDERPTVGYCEGGQCSPGFCDGYVCGSWDMLGLGPCDETLGGGVVSPYGGSASNMDCGFPDDRRYLTDADADLEAKFACAARVGQSGNGSELPLTAATLAVGDALQAAGACNEGFLRDDAILVLTFISDDPPSAAQDDATIGVPMDWYDALVAAKNGNADAIVVAGLVLWNDISCHPFNVETPSFIDFVGLFGDHGVLGSVCDLDYGATFEAAVAAIDQTCDDFDPAG